MAIKTFTELLTETVKTYCKNCGGHGGRFCAECNGAGTFTVNRYSLLADAERVTVLEAEVLRLQGLLADRYETPKCPDCNGTGTICDDSGGNIGVTKSCGCKSKEVRR